MKTTETFVTQIEIRPMTPEAFAPFGDAFMADGTPDRIINAGLCDRFHDRAKLDAAGDGARFGISLFKSRLRSVPYEFDLVERHPEGSQAFIPMSMDPFLVIVAPDADGHPGTPLALLTQAGMAINFHRGTWHGVLTPLSGPGLFAVVDRIGPGANLEEYRYPEPFTVVRDADAI